GLGSRARRSGWRTVPGVRRRRHHADAGTPAPDVAGRQHAADRYGCGNADAAASVRRGSNGSNDSNDSNNSNNSTGRTDLAGKLGRAVEQPGPQSEGDDDKPASGIRAEERRAVQQQGGGDRVL